MKMLLPLGLRGRFAPVYLAGFGDSNLSPLFDANQMMRRFLQGAVNVRLRPGAPDSVDFDAYTVDKLIALLRTAWERSYLRPDGGGPLDPFRTGTRIGLDTLKAEFVNTDEGLMDDDGNVLGYAVRDPVLGPEWNRFESLADPSQAYRTGNRFFRPARAGQYELNIRLTREFWLHVLLKYGYILRQP